MPRFTILLAIATIFFSFITHRVSGGATRTRRLGEECSKKQRCSKNKFCDFEFGNFGNCQVCTETSCFDNPNPVSEGVIDCHSSCRPGSTSGHNTCHGYIIGRDTSIPNTGPFPISCGSRFGDSWGPSEYQESSCCNGDGRYFVAGFEFGYEHPESFPICSAYSTALSGLLCDPRQGDYIRDDGNGGHVLRICRSSCDAVFENCGPPGEVFVSWATYTDGPSLCLDAWGFFGNDHPCDGRPDGYPCQASLSLQVVMDNTNCLDMIYPSESVIEYFKKDERPEPDICKDSNSFSGGFIALFVLAEVLGMTFLVAAAVFLLRKRNNTSSCPGIETLDGKQKQKESARDNVEVVAVQVEPVGRDDPKAKHVLPVALVEPIE